MTSLLHMGVTQIAASATGDLTDECELDVKRVTGFRMVSTLIFARSHAMKKLVVGTANSTGTTYDDSKWSNGATAHMICIPYARL